MEESKKGDETRHTGIEMDETEEPKKGARQRKKLIINKLRVQMEFYFSASNLNKDKFMQSLLSRSLYVDVDIFFRFNRIRALTEDVNILKKAIEKSKILELSEDGFKVTRSKPLDQKEDETICTIYVENIPSHVDHEWVYETFVKYGTIDYLSFPRFKSTGRPKGFAFIEFETPEMANKALESFGAIGCKIPLNTEPSELQSIRTFERPGSDDGKQMIAGVSVDSQLGSEWETEMSVECSTQPVGKNEVGNGKLNVKLEKESETQLAGSEKRKIIEADDDENGVSTSENTEPLRKKVKADTSEAINLLEVKDSKPVCEKEAAVNEAKKRKIGSIQDVIKEARRDSGNAKEVEAKSEEGAEALQSPKKRSSDMIEKESPQKSKKRKVMVDTTNSSLSADSVDEASTGMAKTKKKKKRKRNRKEKGESLEAISLKVMSKQEWTRLRNQYLNMQKQNMESLKWDLLRRKYVPVPRPSGPPSKKQPKFIANAIIKISFEEPPQDPKKLQEAIREGGRGGVAYVELSAVEKDVFVRFVSGEAASTYLKAGLWSRMVLLTGQEEKEYWNHCINSWQMRRNKNKKKGTCNDASSKFRGREKLLQKALREAESDNPNSERIPQEQEDS